MIKKLFSLAALMLMAASCANVVDNVESLRLRAGEDKEVFYATLEGSPDAGTKVYADSKMRTLWNADDRISIFRKTTGNEQFKFTGADGSNAGSFSRVSGSKSQITLDYFYSLYPYSDATSISADGVVSVILPEEQAYKENSFGIGANTMLSVTNSNQLKFRNVGGYLSFKFYGDGVTVKNVTLQGNNHEKLAGPAKVTMPLNGTPTTVMQAQATEAITLTCATPVALGATANEFIEFWFVVPPTTFSKGFTVTVTDIQGGIFTMSTGKERVLARNTLTRMSPIQVVPVPPTSHDAVDLGLSVKWATCNVGADSPEEYGDLFAWGETKSKEKYEWENYKWIDETYTTLTKYNLDYNNGSVDKRTVLELSDDAARVNWGGRWRMPTDAEWTELQEGCNWTWTKQGTTKGYQITSKANGNSIFIPAAGYWNNFFSGSNTYGSYWSSSLYEDTTTAAWYVFFSYTYISLKGYGRSLGLSVRPVCGDPVRVSQVSLDKTELTLPTARIQPLTASILPENAEEKGVRWSSSDPSVASVEANGMVGVVTARQAGTAVITVSTVDGGRTEQCAVTVKAPAERKPVDLGLSVMWATCNVGANSPEEYGDYFAWGETSQKSDYCEYRWETYRFRLSGSQSSNITFTKYNWDSDWGVVDNDYCLDVSDDAATQSWGSNWRMPTEEEWTELKNECTWKTMTQEGTNGYLVTSQTTGKSIFLPLAGRRWYGKLNSVGSDDSGYWSSSLGTGQPRYALLFRIFAGHYITPYERYYGYSIRPVYCGSIVRVSEVRLNKVDLSLKEGESEQLTAMVLPDNAADKGVKWSSSKPSVASVDANGLVTAKEAGTAVITVTTDDGGKTAECTVTVTAPAEPVAIDLGLSVKWATFNVGASSPEEYGDYFAWGETEPKSEYMWTNYRFRVTGDNEENVTLSKYNTKSGHGTVDNRTCLELSDDAAYVNWGESWRMPTNSEWIELRDGCNWVWTTLGGKYGYRITSKTNGNSIFLPAVGYRYQSYLYNADTWGYYWSSTLYSGVPIGALYVYFYSEKVGCTSYFDRCLGNAVRPVYGNLVRVSSVRLNKSSLSLQVGGSEQLTATVLPEDAADKGVKWSSSKPSVASVDANGLVTAKEAGTAVITVTTDDGGKTAECAVTVTAPAGPEAVDLGLSVKWAPYNVGASSPEEYGDYFAWGETEPKETYDWSTYKWCNGDNLSLTKYNYYKLYGTVDNLTLLQMADDAARANWGGSWRMPTDTEWTELRTQCEWTWTSQSGVTGYVVKSKTNTNSIFLPASGSRSNSSRSYGFYWSSSLSMRGPDEAWYLGFNSDSVVRYETNRYAGYTIRPVYGDLVSVSSVRLSKTDISLQVGESEQFIATVLPENASDKGIIWSSSKTSVVSVDANGLVTAKTDGTAVITATTHDGGKTAQCTVTVTYPTPAEPEEAVDLGLSVKWATFNVGATGPEGYGFYFAWGETEMKSDYSWSTYKWCNGSSTTLNKYNYNNEYGVVDNRITLMMDDDAARANWGGSWRMPTDAEWTELRTLCEWTWMTQSGVNGYLVKSRTNSNSIFLPAAGRRYRDRLDDAGSCGYYWSTSLATGYPISALGVELQSDNVYRYSNYRCFGYTVRPVEDGGAVCVSSVRLNKSSLSLQVGGSEQLTATVLPENAADKGVKWSSSKPSVASVDANGLVTAKVAGTAVITVTTDDGGKTAECAVTVTAPAPAGPEAVDLGLSVKWATYNVGASSPEEYGDYFAWGETEPKPYYSGDTYRFLLSGTTYEDVTFSKYNTKDYHGPVDNKTRLDLEDDAAYMNWGSAWRMPTDSEWTELRTRCDWEWTTQGGVKGRKVTGPNGNSIFLPAAGYRYYGSRFDAGEEGIYWSSDLDSDYPYSGCGVYFYPNEVSWFSDDRTYGRSVRPVTE